MRLNYSHSKRGSAMIVVMSFLLIGTMIGLGFLWKSSRLADVSGLLHDAESARLVMEAGESFSQAKLDRAISGINLNGRLSFMKNNVNFEDYTNIQSTYASGATEAEQITNSMLFLKDVTKAQAYTAPGVYNANYEFFNFDMAFKNVWEDPDSSDSQYYQVKYKITALPASVEYNPNRMEFEYEYEVQVRAYGQKEFSESKSQNSGILKLTVEGAPFSRWAIFRDRTTNQNGSSLYFVGNATPEVFFGRVHTNQRPYFLGHPIFQELFSSAAVYGDWTFATNNSQGYTGAPNFVQNYNAGASSVSMPTAVFNTLRMASGDPDSGAATNNTQPTNAELVSFVSEHAEGTIASGTTSLSDGVYIAVNNQSSKTPTGGVFIQGDAAISLDVVHGSSDFNAAQWSRIQGAHQSCKFQKMTVNSATSGIATKDIYIGSDSCEVTYVFNADNSASSPIVLNGRPNGNLHVDGTLSSLGGVSATRPAIATDFAYTISATKDIKITNHIQYEDAEYVSLDANLTPTTSVVANAYGELNGSGILPSAQNIAATMDHHSKTILGLISTQRNVLIETNAPANLNLHAAIYAANSAAFNSGTGLGCGSSSAGCGFGYEGWNTETGKAALKLYGSISEYKNQTIGVTGSPPRGYTKRYSFDTRLANDVTPPGFPISSTAVVRVSTLPLRAWKLSQAQ